jgi:hypothetical protein
MVMMARGGIEPPTRGFSESLEPTLLQPKKGSTVRYLGIEVDDALKISEQTQA